MYAKKLLIATATASLLIASLFVAATFKPPVPQNEVAPAHVATCQDANRPATPKEAAPTSEPPLDLAQLALFANHETPRSPQWPAFRKHIIEKNPKCRACGCKDDLQVHHLVPFNVAPYLELAESNVIVLCGPGGHNDHLWIGHGGSYQHYNPYAKEDADMKWKRIQERLPNKPPGK